MTLSLEKSLYVLFVFLPIFSFARTFVSQNGQKVDGEVIRLEKQTVTFVREVDQKIFIMPLGNFSEEDQRWILQHAPRAEGVQQALSSAQIADYVARINQEIDAFHRQNNISVGGAISDSLYVRRMYLKLAGRIPTAQEVKGYLKASGDKQKKLVEDLIGSPAYLSNEFNYWADLLRINTHQSPDTGEENVLFARWVKESLRTNKPYDVFVRDMLTAKGNLITNPATGYYLRDVGMPLDNLSNTVQIFLGTQMQCAQCHNHPFDTWTQRDFYELAAFRYEINTKQRSASLIPKLRENMKIVMNEDDVDRRTMGRVTGLNLRGIFQQVTPRAEPLRLPRDYKYEDGLPGDVVKPTFLFDDAPSKTFPQGTAADEFAHWLIAPENPRFADVLVNRFWKRALGVGLFEPVDDIRGEMAPQLPAVLAILREAFIRSGFNLQQLNTIIYQTKIMSLPAQEYDPTQDEPHLFTGPAIERMKAENWWDSLMVLFDPAIDQATGIHYKYPTKGERAMKFYQESSDEEIQQYLRSMVAKQNQRDSGKLSEMSPRSKRVENLEYFSLREYTFVSDFPFKRNYEWKRAMQNEKVRASELQSPAWEGHIMKNFGQADRETIESATDEANLSQVLALLNSPFINDEFMKQSHFVKTAKEINQTRERLDYIYLSMLGRYPTEEEKDRLLNFLRQDTSQRTEDLVWAILNSKEYLYVL